MDETPSPRAPRRSSHTRRVALTGGLLVAGLGSVLCACGRLVDVEPPDDPPTDFVDASVTPDGGDGPDGVAPDDNSAGDGGTSNAGCAVRTIGPVYPTIVTVSGNGNAWSSTDSIKVEDDKGAVASSCCTGEDSQVLRAQGFNFQVPPGAEVRGVTVEIRVRQGPGLDDGAADKMVALVSERSGMSEDLKSPAPYDKAFETRTYGGETNLWGLPLTPEDVTAAAFAVAFRTRRRPLNLVDVEVDFVRASVTYCE